jgi:hypothetical protein
MRKVQIYIEGQRLELFDDEKININLSVQNVQDIAKIFTEFTQSFTVPASPHNNAIFQHFYENAVDGTIDHQLRRTASIEIDLIPFRTGTIQIEKSNLKKGLVESYTISFYGDMVSLKDLFKDDKLSVLDMNPYSHLYTGANVKTRIESSTDYDLRWPLISSSRQWTYGGGGNTDISQHSHHIHYDELFPAVKVQKIFEAIETKYGITWDSLFFQDKRFTNLFLWLKNQNTLQTSGQILDLNFTGTTLVSGVDAGQLVDTTNNSVGLVVGRDENIVTQYAYLTSLNTYTTATREIKLDIWGHPNQSTAKWYLYVYENGNLIKTQEAIGTTVSTTISLNYWNKQYTFKAQTSTGDIAFSGMITCYEIQTINPGTIFQTTQKVNVGRTDIQIATNSYTNLFNISANMPDITIYDFISGIFKQFNLTCTPINSTTYKVETLETWYTIGRIVDVTKHIDVDSIDIERVKLYKNISFKHQKSETLLNDGFLGKFDRDYGDLDQAFGYDGGDYKIELPFETMLHQKYTGTNLQVSFSLDKATTPIIPKPVLLYMGEQQTCSFYFNNGSTTSQITTYMPFGQDIVYNGEVLSLNFGWDTSSFYEAPTDNNIYMVYYNNYLNNLYNPKQRLTYVKGLFPTAILTSLKLNDRLIIRDKRYIINDIKTELTTGEVNLVLLHDFRILENAFSIENVPYGTTTVTVPVPLIEGATVGNVNVGTSGVTASPSSFTASANIDFTLPAVSDPLDYVETEGGDLIIFEDFANWLTEGVDVISSGVAIDYTMTNGSIFSIPMNFAQATYDGISTIP